MLDKTIHKHLDNKDLLIDKVKKDLDGVSSSLDLNELIANPEETLHFFAMNVANELVSKYATYFVDEGRRFAQDVVESRKPIVIDTSKDPNKNKEDFNG